MKVKLNQENCWWHSGQNIEMSLKIDVDTLHKAETHE